MSDRSYATHRDTKDQWAGLKSRAVVDRETVRNRLRSGWELERALSTPKAPKGSVVGRVRLLVEQQPGISADELLAAMPDVSKGSIYRSVGREVGAGRFRTIKVSGQNPDGWGSVFGYVLVPVEEQPQRQVAEPDNWVPVPWVNPIRRRALGLPVAQREELPEMDFGNPLRSVA